MVAPRKSLRHHVRPGQLLLVVPDYKVKEPVPWNNIPGLIRRVELHILWWINSRNDPDGDCRYSRNGIYGMLPDQFAFALANLITLAHFSVSSAINFPKSAGETTNTVAPRSATRAFSLGSLHRGKN